MTSYPIVEQKIRPFDLRATNMVCRQISDSVWAVMADNVDDVDHTATNGGFIVGSDAVLAVESLSNRRLAEQLLRAAQEHGGTPRYLVNTSYHGDHCFGNFAFPKQTVIIAHERTLEKLADDFEIERIHMIEFMGEGTGAEEVLPRLPELRIRDTIEIDLGGVTVEVQPIGLIQTPGDLAVHVRQERVVFVGNAINGPPPAFPWVGGEPIDEVIASYRRLQETLAPDTTIVTGHGNFMRPSDISFSICYLEQLAITVADCIGKGLGVEAAAQDAQLARYSAYSMYDLAHRKVNLPGQFERAIPGPLDTPAERKQAAIAPSQGFE